MAFYFALMNVSNASLDRASKRRSSSLSRYHHHNYHQVPRNCSRRTTIALPDADVLPRSNKLAIIASPTVRIHRKCLEVPKDTKQTNDNQEKKVTFEKRKPNEASEKMNSFPRNRAFLDDREVKMNVVNVEKEDIVTQPAHLVMVPHSVDADGYRQQNARKKSLPIWKTSFCRGIADTRISAKKKSLGFRRAEKINEAYCPGSPACSDRVQRALAQTIVSSTSSSSVQNVANELIENEQMLHSAPPRRRRFWKPTTLLRRRSTSDSYPKYTWSYFNPGFRFVEEEYRMVARNCNGAIRTDENCNILSSYIYSELLPLTEDSRRTR